MKADPRVCGGIAAVASLCVLLSAGCVGYRVGSSLPADIHTIYVPTFVNKSGEPLLEVRTTSAAANEFQRDGTLAVVSDETHADLTLAVTLKGLTLEPLRYSQSDRKSATEYRLHIDAKIVCRRTRGGAVLVSQDVNGESTFTFAGSLAAGKLSALPKASSDLAHNIVEAIVEAW